MTTGVVTKSYVTHYQKSFVKKKKVKARFTGIFYIIGKRFFDVVVSLLFTVLVLSWLIPILAILIKLDSKGPVFFIQTRIGFLGIPFRCYKLRTMVVNQDSDSQQAMYNDQRITRLGHFLRITSLDELPQFLNVIIGNMSIVGPRPFMKKDDQEFSITVSNYPLRYCAKPGITGMAQVKGYRGRTDNFLSIFHRYQWDAFYIRNARPSLDFKILRITASQTIKSIFSFKTIKLKQLERLNLSETKFLLENLR
ncbi:MAG TPA: sugar transferase [Puia sp.]|jgi:putative colanic acid biosynthesis UDP-glucose lipid carrier transferase|nr:sugar transferase [Puia sp.]